MTDLKKSKNIEKVLEKHKNLVFKKAMEAVFGPKVWKEIENLKKTP